MKSLLPEGLHLISVLLSRHRHRHSHRHRHRDNLQSMKLPVDSAVVGYPAAAAGVPAELPKPASPKRHHRHRHHSPPAEPSRVHIHHHIYCEAGAPIQGADEAPRWVQQRTCKGLDGLAP